MTTPKNYDRITFSLPHRLNHALDELKEESKRSKSEIIKMAIEHYIEKQKREKLQHAIEIMATEYEENSDLTALTALDAEDFQ